MINSLAVLSLIASVAVAQQASTSATLIPTGLSPKCSDFISKLNKDTTLSPCTSSLISATSAFAPGVSPSASAVNDALEKIAKDSTQCSEKDVRSTLANFSKECSTELNADSDQARELILLYDYVYSLVPVRNAISAKGDDGSWCLTTVAKTVEATSKPNIEKYLVVQERSAVNGTTFSSSNAAFGFLQPSLSNEVLCTTCTRKILSAWIDFGSNTPHAVGLESSVLLKGQKSLLDAVDTKCGNDFFGGAVQAAGGISAGFGSANAAISSSSVNMKTTALALFGVAAWALL